MTLPLRVLMIEDAEEDALLILRDLKRAGYAPEHCRVDTASALVGALDAGPWDVVLSDYSMPQFSGFQALGIVRQRDPELPFIFVSGTIGEDVAVEAMRAGAHDYIVKENLRRLAPAVAREIREASLRRQRLIGEAQFRRVVECDMMGIFFWEPGGAIAEGNDEFLRIMGRSRDDLSSGRIHWLALTPPEFAAADEHALAELAAGGACTPYEKEILRPDARRVPVLVGGARLQERESLVGFVLDMTERRQAAEALLARERQQAAVVGLGQLALKKTELSQLFSDAAVLVAETLGVTLSEILEVLPDGKHFLLRAGQGWPDASIGQTTLPIDDRTRIGHALRHNEAVIVSDGAVDQRFTDSGLGAGHRAVSGASVAIPMAGRMFGVLGVGESQPRTFSRDDMHFLHAVAHVLGSAIDRGRTESAFRQAQRLESVGRLAGGVAHDFNNLLTIIMMHTEFLLDALVAQPEAHSDAQEIQSASRRASALTKQLLAFSRRQRLETKVVNLNDTVSEIHKMLGRLIGTDVTLQVVLQPDLDLVEADPGQLEQVLMNLAVNARDAMPGGGILLIETSNVTSERAAGALPDEVLAGRFVRLAVTDTGIGMDREVQSRVFEPFFTTKTPEKGTGLGLATVYGIVKQSGGTILLTSEAGRGTTFEVFLPSMLPTEPAQSTVPGGAA